MLLDMQKQIVAHRSAKKKDDLEAVDWRKFYEGEGISGKRMTRLDAAPDLPSFSSAFIGSSGAK
jgi:hypothetical protein